jgi:hypothetical protein
MADTVERFAPALFYWSGVVLLIGGCWALSLFAYAWAIVNTLRAFRITTRFHRFILWEVKQKAGRITTPKPEAAHG